MDRQTLRDWVHRFNDEGPSGLVDRRGSGPSCQLSAAQLEVLSGWVEVGPDPAVGDVVRWRCADLAAKIATAFRAAYSERGVAAPLRRLGFRIISARARIPRTSAAAQAAFKKSFTDLVAATLDQRARGKPLEVWFQDEARIGQKNHLVYAWARTCCVRGF